MKRAAPNEFWSLGQGVHFSALRELGDVTELQSLNLRNPAEENSPWKIGYRQVSFGCRKREGMYIGELQSSELDINPG